MEEASALADKVAIIATRLLGTSGLFYTEVTEFINGDSST